MRIVCHRCSHPIDLPDNTQAGTPITCAGCGNTGTYTPKMQQPGPKQRRGAGGLTLGVVLGATLGILFALCVGGTFALALPWPSLVLAVLMIVMGSVVLVGKVGRGWRGRWWIGGGAAALGMYLALFSVVGVLQGYQTEETRLEEEQQAAELQRQQQAQAEAQAAAEAQRLAELRANATEILAQGRSALGDARARLEAGQHVDAHRVASAASAQVSPLATMNPPVNGAAQLARELTQLMESSAHFVNARQSIATAENAAEAEYADALAALSAYEAQLAAVGQIDGEPATVYRRDIRGVTRTLERRARSVRRAATRIRRERVYSDRGLIPVTARDLFRAFHGNEVAAEARYKNRRVAVTGVITGIRTDMFGDALVDLRTSNQFMPVRAEMADRSAAARLNRGDQVELDCECKGMVIGSVGLDDCRFLQ